MVAYEAKERIKDMSSSEKIPPVILSAIFKTPIVLSPILRGILRNEPVLYLYFLDDFISWIFSISSTSTGIPSVKTFPAIPSPGFTFTASKKFFYECLLQLL